MIELLPRSAPAQFLSVEVIEDGYELHLLCPKCRREQTMPTGQLWNRKFRPDQPEKVAEAGPVCECEQTQWHIAVWVKPERVFLFTLTLNAINQYKLMQPKSVEIVEIPFGTVPRSRVEKVPLGPATRLMMGTSWRLSKLREGSAELLAAQKEREEQKSQSSPQRKPPSKERAPESLEQEKN